MDKVTNKEILERTGLPSMEDLLIRKNLRWTGHLMRMSPDRLPKQVLYSQLSSDQRKRGRPRLRFKDTIKRNLKLRDIKIDSWTSLSQQRARMESNSQVMEAVLSLRDRQHDDYSDACVGLPFPVLPTDKESVYHSNRTIFKLPKVVESSISVILDKQSGDCSSTDDGATNMLSYIARCKGKLLSL